MNGPGRKVPARFAVDAERHLGANAVDYEVGALRASQRCLLVWSRALEYFVGLVTGSGCCGGDTGSPAAMAL